MMLLSLYVKGQNLRAALRDRFVDERGAVATEYGLLLVLIALAIVVAAVALGLAISGVFQRGSDTLNSGPAGS
jgi:pilus assembly protein Flp/PilA